MLGFPVLRLRGDYLAIVTLGFGEIIRLLLINLNMLTGGPDGISGLPKPSVLGMEMARRASTEGGQTFHEIMGWTFQNQHMVIYLYLMALALALATLFVSTRLIRMPVGRAGGAARRRDRLPLAGPEPHAHQAVGLHAGRHVRRFRRRLLRGPPGHGQPRVVHLHRIGADPGHRGAGRDGLADRVILAAILLTVLPELAREFAEYRMLMFGLVMVLMMMWRPQGLLPMKRPHVELRK